MGLMITHRVRLIKVRRKLSRGVVYQNPAGIPSDQAVIGHVFGQDTAAVDDDVMPYGDITE